MKLLRHAMALSVCVGALVPIAVLGQQVYFPSGTFDSLLQRWYSAELHVLKEPSLSKHSVENSVETYRFLWLRTFHPPIVVRLTVNRDGMGTLTAKMGNGESGFPYTTKQIVKDDTIAIPAKQVESFLAEVDKLRYWSLPTDVNPDQIGTDGSQWIIEGTRQGQYHVVARWSPDSSPNKCAVRKLGLFLAIDLARLDIPPKEIY